jgi:hypothetical protein
MQASRKNPFFQFSRVLVKGGWGARAQSQPPFARAHVLFFLPRRKKLKLKIELEPASFDPFNIPRSNELNL